MELKLDMGILVQPKNRGLNRTFYGIETWNEGHENRSFHKS